MTETLRELAALMARWDRNHRKQLVAKRRARGMTQADVANLMGVRPGWVRRFEQYDSDPRLSELRRYEAAIHHQQTPVPEHCPPEGNGR